MRRLLARGILVLAVLVAPLTTALAEKRVALVIGNSDYRHTAQLENPRNDAADIAIALRRLGFTVIEGVDLDKPTMERRIREFSTAIDGADVGLFFYAGHGLQVDGQNYLAPVDAALKSETDLDFEAIRLGLVLRQLERNARLSLVFLDACRDNPMATTLARSLKARSRSVSVGRGLARVEKAVGMMIAFATQPGNVALDGKGRNSPFTRALLENIGREGATVGDMMIEVRNDVIDATDGKQVPWENSSLTGKFYFKPKAGGGPKVATTTRPHRLDVPNTTFDHTYWTSIRDSDDPAFYADYLRRFPDGVFALIARAKLAELRGIKVDETPGKTSGEPSGGKDREVEQARLQTKDDAEAAADEKIAAAVDAKAVELRLVRDTQSALKRLGCYRGAIDGKWGRGSRAAMGRFNRAARRDLPLEPSAASLGAIEASKGIRCTVVTKKRIERPQEPRKAAKKARPHKPAAKKSRKKKTSVATKKPRRQRPKPRKRRSNFKSICNTPGIADHDCPAGTGKNM